MADLNNTIIEDPPKEDRTITTPDIKPEIDDKSNFPCDKCERVFSKKQARAVHLSSTHKIKTIIYTPGIIRQNSKKQMETRQSLKCTLCSFTCKSKPHMKMHMDAFHKKQKVCGTNRS